MGHLIRGLAILGLSTLLVAGPAIPALGVNYARTVTYTREDARICWECIREDGSHVYIQLTEKDERYLDSADTGASKTFWRGLDLCTSCFSCTGSCINCGSGSLIAPERALALGTQLKGLRVRGSGNFTCAHYDPEGNCQNVAMHADLDLFLVGEGPVTMTTTTTIQPDGRGGYTSVTKTEYLRSATCSGYFTIDGAPMPAPVADGDVVLRHEEWTWAPAQ